MNHTPDYDNMVKRGYRWYIDQCKEKLANHVCKDVYDMEQRINWEAMIIAMEAIISFAHRYADLAEKQAAECTDPKRKEELLTMAENCRRVPEFALRLSCRLFSWFGSPILLSYWRRLAATTVWDALTSICILSLRKRPPQEGQKSILLR